MHKYDLWSRQSAPGIQTHRDINIPSMIQFHVMHDHTKEECFSAQKYMALKTRLYFYFDPWMLMPQPIIAYPSPYHKNIFPVQYALANIICVISAPLLTWFSLFSQLHGTGLFNSRLENYAVLAGMAIGLVHHASWNNQGHQSLYQGSHVPLLIPYWSFSSSSSLHLQTPLDRLLPSLIHVLGLDHWINLLDISHQCIISVRSLRFWNTIRQWCELLH